MAGPSRTNGKPRPGPIGPQPRRPPNAWILYRSDKLRELTAQRDPSAPKRLQADISKEIADFWKTEDPEVKREYERIADIKKQEHMQAYPGYKFQPVKKEDKAKRREEEKAEKARVKEELKKAKARHVPYVQQDHLAAGPTPQLPQPPFTHPNYPYCPLGPSPPLSAASSPMCTPSPLSIAGELPDEDMDVKMAFPGMTTVMLPPTQKRLSKAAGKKRAYNARMPPPPLPERVQPQPPPAPLTPESISPPSASGPQSVELPMVDASSASTSAPMDPPGIMVSSADPVYASAQAEQEMEDVAMDMSTEAGPSSMDLDALIHTNQLELMPTDDTDTFNFDMQLSDIVGADWLQPQALDDSFMGSNANATGAPGVYELAPIPTAEFNVFPPPSMNIELGVMSGPMRTSAPEEVAVFAELLDGIDWQNMPGGALFGSMQGDWEVGGAGDGMDMDMGIDPSMMQEQPRSVTQNDLLQQFLNMTQLSDVEESQNGGGPSTSSAQLQMEVPPPPAQVPTPSTPRAAISSSSTGYTPPSGAANFSKRRVAGSWKASPRA
ncbi:uncharacterized protein C8Q71DRAFT_453437 [Rhodofomes roseus]|uniref:HMG box domain-containing protein n=1 Tax=Rhodofomes roseus TaxID=34475 RepID=A0ABQ8JXJ4_9APHY|nr:uncharacterized protein C8Q71DRAFT_453437 [Rhodofomes roseus]KAH9828829.1 hypothetical protein C8Q71DRAFT_453437 [Rhodofomes roseus]